MRKIIFTFFLILLVNVSLGSITHLNESFGNGDIFFDLDRYTTDLQTSPLLYTPIKSFDGFWFGTNFNDWYAVEEGGSWSIETTTDYAKSGKGIKVNVTNKANDPRYVRSAFLTILDDPINLDPKTNISYRSRYHTIGSYSIVFWKSNGYPALCIPLKADSPCPSPFNPKANNNITWTISAIDTTEDKSFSLTEVLLDTTYAMDQNNLTGIKAIGLYQTVDSFLFPASSPYSYWIDDLNINLIENQLPEVNITYDHLACQNDTTPWVWINVNITAHDPDGDQIIYGYVDNHYTNQQYYTYDFHQYPWIHDYSFLRNTVTRNTSCEYSTTDWYQEGKHNVIQDYQNTSMWSIPTDAQSLLHLNPLCEGDSEFIYKFHQPLKYPYFETELTSLPADNYYMDLVFYDKTFIPIYNVTMSRSLGNGNTTIYINQENRGNYNIPYNKTIYFQSAVNIDGSSLTIGDVYLFNLTKYQPVQYFSIKSNFSVYINYFTYKNILEENNWKSGKMLGINTTSVGQQDYIIFVTDTYHNGTSYNYYRIQPKVVDCKYYTEGLGTFEDDFNIFELSHRTFGKSLISMVSSIRGGHQKMKTLIWWTFICLFLFINVGLFLTTRKVAIIIPLILSSAFCWFLSYNLEYTTHQISFLILIAMGLMGPVSKLYMGVANE